MCVLVLSGVWLLVSVCKLSVFVCPFVFIISFSVFFRVILVFCLFCLYAFKMFYSDIMFFILLLLFCIGIFENMFTLIHNLFILFSFSRPHFLQHLLPFHFHLLMYFFCLPFVIASGSLLCMSSNCLYVLCFCFSSCYFF